MIVETAASVASFAAVAAWAVRGRSSAVFGRSVWRGARDRRSVALTFDDGPSESTPDLLDLLNYYRVPATFFQCGVLAERHPHAARMVSDAGHDIGNHSYSHARLWLRSPEFIHTEMSRAQQALCDIHGFAPRLFRAPYGARWFGVRRAQNQLNLLGVMWTTIGRDWVLSSDAIVRRLKQGAQNGAIFCLHDGRGIQPRPNVRPTIEAVRKAVPLLRDQGYQFETVTQILCRTTSPSA